MFSWRMRVYQEDVDSGGIVYYVNYLKFMERARSEWLRSKGLDQHTLLAEGIIFVVKQCDVVYHAPAKLDDELQIDLEISNSSKVQFTVSHSLTRLDQSVGQVEPTDQQAVLDASPAVTGSATIVCLNHKTMKPMRMPNHFRVW